MATTDAPATLSELQTALLNHVKEATGVTAINNIATRYLNEANQLLHQERWPWQERRSTIRTIVPYTTGTATIAITSLTTRRTVTGASTAWNTTNSFGDLNGIGAGAKMTLGGSLAVYLVSSVDSDTQVTLDSTTPYTSASALSAGSYALYQDEYALPADYDGAIDARFFDEDRSIELCGSQEFYRRYATNSIRQRPSYATVVQLGPSGSTALRPRILLGPAPDQTYIIPFRYYTTYLAVSSAGVGAVNLSATDDEPIVPVRWRWGIVYKAAALWYQGRVKNPQLAGQFETLYAAVVLAARSRTVQTDERPRLRPDVRSYWTHRNYGRVTRYDNMAAWDQLRY